ncbi:MAG: carbohydrate kinase family protein [Chloroflexi bacterium]|nr:carbohydrate kinase family protein [Chloroflexota bacterium]
MTIFVSGSLAYDRIMNFPGRFSDHILPDRIHNINVSFNVDSMVERPGGCAGNISYCLVLLGEQPLTLATLGRDCRVYLDWMEENGVGVSGVRVIDPERTASAYIMTDQGDNQITGFHMGAMLHSADFSFDFYDMSNALGVVSPGNLEDMANFSQYYKENGVPYVFDPGQSLPAWTADGLRECIDGATVLIANDYEIGLIANMTGLDESALAGLAKAVIVTKGEHGSELRVGGEVTPIPVVTPRQALDPTGAGDAYRGGLVKGMVEGKTLAEAALMGSVCASFAVEVQGTQEYRFTMDEFNERLAGVKAG